MTPVLPNRFRQRLLLLLLIASIPTFSSANDYFTPMEVSISATGDGLLTCANTSVTLTATSSVTNTSFTWTGPNGFTATGAVAIVTQQGSYMVTAISSEGVKVESFSVVQAATTAPLWTVDFSQPNGTTAVNTGAAKWTAAHTGVNTTQFAVLNHEFAINNSKQGKEGTWTSEVINITGTTTAAITADLRSSVKGNGSLENDTTAQGDYVRLYYKLNGGPEVLFCEKRGNINNNSATYTTVVSELLTGAALQVIIRSRASANDEYYYFDNIQLAAVTPANITASATVSETLT